LLVSKDNGLHSWKDVSVYKFGTTPIQDFLVKSSDEIYAITTADFSKSTNGGGTWTTKEGLNGIAGYDMSLAPNNDILVGGSDGYISFSKDAGATFSKTSLLKAGKVFVVADSAYATNNIIYGAVGTNLYRGKAQSTQQSWLGRGPDLANGFAGVFASYTYTGISRVGSVIYALTSDLASGATPVTGTTYHSTLWQAMNLATANDAGSGPTGASWSFISPSSANIGVFNAVPQSLKISATNAPAPKIWAVNTVAGYVNSLNDPVAVTAPTVSSPASGVSVTVNPLQGTVYNVTFVWKRYSSQYVTNMNLQISTDSTFNSTILDSTIIGINADTVSVSVGPSASGPMGVQRDFIPGTTYYWRVRSGDGTADGQLYSPFTAVRNFRVDLATQFAITTPKSGDTDVSITPTFVWTPYAGAIG